MLEFTIPTPISILAVGGYSPQDEQSPAAQFVKRFGHSWKRVPKSKDVYVLFDTERKVAFSLRGDEIAMYPGVTREEFIASWEGDRALIAANAIYETVDGKWKHHYLQLQDMMRRHGVQ